jgi:hypothetical protein
MNMISPGLLAATAIIAIYSLVGAWIGAIGDRSESGDMFEWSSSFGAAGVAICAIDGLFTA